MRAAASSAETPRVIRPKPTLASMLIQGNRPLSWKTIAFSTDQPRASILIAPPLGAVSPARMRSSVDFPQPDGPTMQRNSPGAMRRLISSSATTRAGPLRYSLHSPAISIAGPRGWRDGVVGRGRRAGAAAAGERALFVLEYERGALAHGVVDIAFVHEPIGGKFGVAHLALVEPCLHVEHAGDIDRAVRTAGRPRLFVPQFPPRFRAA